MVNLYASGGYTLAKTKLCKNPENLGTIAYSSDSTPLELSNEYQHGRADDF